MNRSLTIPGFVVLVAVFVLAASACYAGEQPPNILFIFADDQCFETIHALGNDEIETPNLDRLARAGVTFTHAYNMGAWNGAVCVASRTMLNTGRFVWRARANGTSPNEEAAAGRFWSEYLSGSGYETYMTGKWHVKADAPKVFDHTVHIRPGMPKDAKPATTAPSKASRILGSRGTHSSADSGKGANTGAKSWRRTHRLPAAGRPERQAVLHVPGVQRTA